MHLSTGMRTVPEHIFVRAHIRIVVPSRIVVEKSVVDEILKNRVKEAIQVKIQDWFLGNGNSCHRRDRSRRDRRYSLRRLALSPALFCQTFRAKELQKPVRDIPVHRTARVYPIPEHVLIWIS